MEKSSATQPKIRGKENYPIILIVITAIFALIIFLPLFLSYYLNRPEQSMDKAREQISAKNYSAAEENLKRVVAKNPKDDTAYRLLGQVFYLQKNYQGAYDSYNKAYQIDSSRQDLLNLMANCQRDMGNYDEAEKLYQEAITKNPKSTIPYQNLAVMLRNLNKKKEAISILRQGIKVNPKSDILKKLLKSIEKN